MKKTAAVLLALGVMFSMSACDRDRGEIDSQREFDVELLDGRTVHCIKQGHGMSCDWENAK